MHKEDDEIKLEEHLRKMHNKGVNLYLEDRPASPEEIARKFLSAKMPSTCLILSPIRMANYGKYGMIR